MALRTVGSGRDDTIVGRIDRDPWGLRDVDATIREDDPTFHYSPGFEMRVLPEEVRSEANGRERPATGRPE